MDTVKKSCNLEVFLPFAPWGGSEAPVSLMSPGRSEALPDWSFNIHFPSKSTLENSQYGRGHLRIIIISTVALIKNGKCFNWVSSGKNRFVSLKGA